MQQVQMPMERTLTFFGPMRTPATNQLRAALMVMINEGAESITVHFASDGGSTDDGMALYTFIRSLSAKVTMHAVGNVGSIAIPVFLAADDRLASSNAHFFFHEYSWTHAQPSIVTQTTMNEQTAILARAMEWTKEIIRTRTALTDDDFEHRRMFNDPLLMRVDEAKAAGIIQAISEPKIESGQAPRIVLW